MSTRFTPCLWFDTEAEEAANYYVSIFPNSRITTVSRYPSEGTEVHRQPAGSVMVAVFELDGQPFTALNGGPKFKFNEAVSFQIPCENQEEIDYYWDKLTEGGDPKAQQCGWLKDKFGLSWQVIPRHMDKLFSSGNRGAAMQAMLKMKKIDIAEIERARDS
jgi:predicted 3-demethylubiquinone-9 3-methyltransferase (glyoxalase superfamily)